MSDRPLDIRFGHGVPEGDNRERLVCDHCGFIHYVNPKVVVGSVCEWEDGRILICRRSIEPREGFWTVPAGFLEEGETTEEGACREAREEALADIEIDALLGIYNVPHISQVHVFYRARLRSPDVEAGPESREVALVEWRDVPWDDLAFESVTRALRYFGEIRDRQDFVPFRFP